MVKALRKYLAMVKEVPTSASPALHFLTLVIVMIISAILNWGFFAYSGLYMVLIIFLTLSALNHLITGIKENFVLNTLLRPLLVVFMWAITLYFLLPALAAVK